MDHPADRPTGKRVLLMATCLCDAFFADAARATVEILEHLGVEVLFPPDQTCCGQPAFNSGDWLAARKVMRHTASVFGGDLPIIVPSGSCAAMHFHGAGQLFDGEADAPVAAAMGRRTWEVLDFIVHGLGVRAWPGSYPARVSFHHSCHTRGTGTREAALTLLGSIDGLELSEVGDADQCCGFGGTFSVTFPHISTGMGQLKLDHLLASEPRELVSADMSCLMHLAGLAQKAGRPVVIRHAAEILAAAMVNARGPAGTPPSGSTLPA